MRFILLIFLFGCQAIGQQENNNIKEDAEFRDLLNKVEANTQASGEVQKKASESQNKIVKETITKIDTLNKKGIDKTYEIWCDSSEPRSIEELYRMGFNAKAVTKGPDSIRFGISVLQNHKIHILKQSQNLINEMYAYQYATDKHGYVTDTPEGGLDHLLDALRYVGMMKLSQKAQSKGKYAISIGKYKY